MKLLRWEVGNYQERGGHEVGGQKDLSSMKNDFKKARERKQKEFYFKRNGRKIRTK